MYVHLFWHEYDIREHIKSRVEMKVYGMADDNLTQAIQTYLSMLRVDFEYVEIAGNEYLLKTLTDASSGELKLVWIELGGELRLVESLAALCTILQCEGFIQTTNK